MIAKTLLTAAALVTLGFTTSAYAAPANAVADDGSSVSIRIQVGELDLRSELGAKVALRRIRNAAKSICGDAPNAAALGDALRYRACVTGIVDRSVVSLDNPMVTALNAGTARPRATAASSLEGTVRAN